MSGLVPEAWNRIVEATRDAGEARAVMRDTKATQRARDAAVVTYSRVADQIIDELIALREAKYMGRITLLLAKKERA